LILVEVGEYWLDSARVSIDVDDFNMAMANARSAINNVTAAEWYERAAALVQGEYLQNLYYEWVFPERRRLAQSYLNALQELAAHYLSTHAPKQAAACAEKAIALDSLNEDLYCLYMRAHAELGDRASLARTYAELQSRLRAELNTKPMPDTLRLYSELMNVN
jgi:two-component SAPR family response regulator